ncbi:MAG: hypothetical protein WBL05_08725 [Brooklawnia sp.]|uniref:hypothetical protein n=1 Tax=Brooklawnia sp. TaxID=2699740 RepID=UPI003C752C85
MTDETWWQLLLAFGFGLAGSVLPLANAEAFIVASVATGVLGPVPVGVLLGAGQGVGKMLVFQGIRQGRRQLVRRRPRREPAPIRPGTWRARWARLVEWSIALVEHPRWGPVGLFLSGSLSVPPNYLTTVVAATTRLNFAVFAVFLTAGFMARYVVIALAAAGVFEHVR